MAKRTSSKPKAAKEKPLLGAYIVATDNSRPSEIRIDFAGGAVIQPLHMGKTTWAELEAFTKNLLANGRTGDKVSFRYLAGSYGGNVALTMHRPSGAHYTAAEVMDFLKGFARKEIPELFIGEKTANRKTPKRSDDAELGLEL